GVVVPVDVVGQEGQAVDPEVVGSAGLDGRRTADQLDREPVGAVPITEDRATDRREPDDVAVEGPGPLELRTPDHDAGHTRAGVGHDLEPGPVRVDDRAWRE